MRIYVLSASRELRDAKHTYPRPRNLKVVYLRREDPRSPHWSSCLRTNRRPNVAALIFLNPKRGTIVINWFL